jgi:hypothetical protein
MPTYACIWENKNVTVVCAPDRKAAIELLDELADARDNDLVEIKSPVMFTLRGMKNDEWDYVAEGLGEDLDVELGEMVFGDKRFGAVEDQNAC